MSTLRKYIDEFDIDLTRINENRSKYFSQLTKKDNRFGNKGVPLELIISGEYDKEYKSDRLAKRLIDAGYKEYRCEKCGLSEWLGNPIPLHMHHKDGNHLNNKLENIELLCPNCHAMTDNYAGKNINHEKKILPNNNRKSQKGISEDGLRLYDGYGNYKVLCPICKENYMNREA